MNTRLNQNLRIHPPSHIKSLHNQALVLSSEILHSTYTHPGPQGPRPQGLEALPTINPVLNKKPPAYNSVVFSTHKWATTSCYYPHKLLGNHLCPGPLFGSSSAGLVFIKLIMSRHCVECVWPSLIGACVWAFLDKRATKWCFML